METFDKPYISVVGKPQKDADLEDAISWKHSDIGFNWVSTEYPYLHAHSSHWELFIVTQGTLKHVLNGHSYVMQEGEACFLRPQDRHMILKENGKPLMTLSFLLKKNYCRSLFDTVKIGLYDEIIDSSTPLQFKISEYDLKMICTKVKNVQRFIPELEEENVVKTKICFLGIFDLFIEKLVNLHGGCPPWVEALLGELNNSDLYLSQVKDIAKKTPYSYSRMSALFKQYVGISLAKYLNRLKMNQAINLLTNSTESILDIALDLGYESLSSFNHSFKSTFGISPSAYRKNNFLKP